MRFCCCVSVSALPLHGWSLIVSNHQGVPIVNAGAYLIVIENFLLGLGIAVLAFVPPEIVALMGTIPSWSKVIVGILGIVLLVWQVAGIISIASQKTGFYRTYIRINFLLTLAIIAAAAAFLIAAAVQHSNAVKSCAKNFGVAPTGDGTGYEVPGAAQNSTTIGQNICNAFVWVQVGLMGFLIVLWSLTQVRPRSLDDGRQSLTISACRFTCVLLSGRTASNSAMLNATPNRE